MSTRYLPSSLQHPKTILISEVEEDLGSRLPAKIRKLEQDEEVCVVGYFESFAVCLSSHTASFPSVSQFKGVIVPRSSISNTCFANNECYWLQAQDCVRDRRTVKKQHYFYTTLLDTGNCLLFTTTYMWRSFSMYVYKSFIVMMQ